MNVGSMMVTLALNITDFDKKLDDAEAKGLSFTETLKSIFATADPKVNIDVKDGHAEVKIEEFKALLDSIPDERTTRLRTTGGSTGAAAGGAGAGILGAVIAGVIPSVAPLAAAATNAVMGLASAFTAAGIGAVGFAAVAIPNLKTIFTASANLTKAEQAYDKAVTSKQKQAALRAEQQAVAGLDAAQLKALASLRSFESFWKGFTASFQSPVLSLFAQGLKGLQALLTDLKPAISAAATAFGTLMSQFNSGLGGSQAKAFFNFLATTAGPDIVALGDVFGNIFGGIMNLMVAFGPTGQSMAQSLVRMTESFRSWAAGLKGTKGFEEFLKYAAASGKAVISLIGNLAHLVGTLLKDMAPLGLVMVKLVSDFIKWVNQLMTTNPLIKTLVSIVFTVAKNLLVFVDAVIKMFTWLGKTHPVIMDIITALGLATAAWVALNAVMAMNPITLVIIAIVALVAAGVELVRHWTQVKQFFAGLWTWFTTETTKVWNGIATFFTKMWKDITSGITKAWDVIVKFFKKYGLDILAALTGPIGVLVLYLVKHWSQIKADASKAWNDIKSFLHGLWTGTIKDAESIFSGLGTFFTGLWTQAEQWGANIIHHIAQGIENAAYAVERAAQRVAQKIKNMLGFGSPTKEGPGSTADQWMPNLMNMLVQGIQAGTPRLHAALSTAIVNPTLGGAGTLRPLGTNLFSALTEGNTRPVIVYLDGREVARGTAPHLVNEIRLQSGLRM